VDDAKFRRLTAHIQIVHQSDILMPLPMKVKRRQGSASAALSKSTAAAEWSLDREITCQFSVAYTPIISLVDFVASESQHHRD
jgi:hypothetical protein